MVRRAAVQVSQQEARAEEAAAAAAAAAGGAAGSGYFGYGVAEKRGGVFALDKDVFWFARQTKDRFRWNMLNPFPVLRQVGVDRARPAASAACCWCVSGACRRCPVTCACCTCAHHPAALRCAPPRARTRAPTVCAERRVPRGHQRQGCQARVCRRGAAAVCGATGVCCAACVCVGACAGPVQPRGSQASSHVRGPRGHACGRLPAHHTRACRTARTTSA
jgi:hypothetical protein